MQLGAFSLSLNVQDIQASRAFYEALGFEAFMGEAEQGWLILRNGSCVIGLFQGMLAQNTFTFNPGWDSEARELPDFTDLRDLQRELQARGLNPERATNENSSGPDYFLLRDPDGNPILVDQHR
jgi:catechol 2,3-dioxygenase-like lactoylglutathione lyase family enzyme